MRWAACVLFATARCLAAPFAATRLRVEYADAPINIDDYTPRFSWALNHSSRGATQTAWRIVVTRTFPITVAVWDSGLVHSSQTLNVVYGSSGNFTMPFQCDSDYQWMVQWWDNENATAPVAATSTFSTALLTGPEGADDYSWLGAQWVGGGSLSKNTLRAVFTLGPDQTPKHARLYVASLGAHTTTINGQRSDTHRLSSYTVFERRVGYFVTDVTALLKPGCNVLGVTIGGGRFGIVYKSYPRAVRIVLSVDGVPWVSSNAASTSINTLLFNATNGPIVADDEFDGETYDARISTALGPWSTQCNYTLTRAWTPAVALTPNVSCGGDTPPCRLRTNAVRAPVRTDPQWTPAIVSVVAGEGGRVFIADTGAGTAGYCGLVFPDGCPSGTTVTLTYGEQLLPNGSITDNRKMVDTYICGGSSGAPEVYKGPSFAYFGYRWIAVRGHPSPAGPQPADFSCVSIHADLPPTGTFSTGGSSSTLDAVLRLSRASILANTQSTPTDDPNRSRQGWNGDAHLAAEPAIHLFDAGAFFTQHLRAIADSQWQLIGGDFEGAVPDISPYYGDSKMPSDVTWSAAFPFIASWMRAYYNDTRVVQLYASGIADYADYLIANSSGNPGGLLHYAKYGDWETLEHGGKTSLCITNMDYVSVLDVAAAFLTELGNASSARYANAAAGVRGSILDLLANANGSFCFGQPVHMAMAIADGALVLPPVSSSPSIFSAAASDSPSSSTSAASESPSSYSLRNQPSTVTIASPVHLPSSLSRKKNQSLVPFDSVSAALVRAVSNGPYPNHTSGGILATKHVPPALSRAGLTSLALAMLEQPTFPGFGAWLADGATTLRESWPDLNANIGTTHSFDHQMFAGAVSWLFKDIAGVDRAQGSVSWLSLEIAPHASISPPLLRSSAYLDTPVGVVAVSWEAAAAALPPFSSLIPDATSQNSISNTYAAATAWPALTYLNLTVPTGGTALVSIPIGSEAAFASVQIADAATVPESMFWTGGQFVPGACAGVVSAKAQLRRDVGPNVEVLLLGGVYELWCVYK